MEVYLVYWYNSIWSWHYNYLDCAVTNNASGTREIKSRITEAISVFNKKTISPASLLNFRKKLVKRHIWTITLYGAETWTLRKTDQKRLESFEMLCWKRIEKIIWNDCVKNELLRRVKWERHIVHTVKRRKANWIGHMLRRNCLLKHVAEVRMEGRKEGRKEKSDGKTRKKRWATTGWS